MSLAEFDVNHSISTSVIPEQRKNSRSKSPRLDQTTSEKATQNCQEVPASQCLFCRKRASNSEMNLVHMSTTHSFHVPDINDLQTDVETLLGYLHCVIHEFHSCLFCGTCKYSAEAVKAHMVSKGHCMLDLSAGSDFLDFWDSAEEADEEGVDVEECSLTQGDNDTPKMLAQVEMLLLPSGARIFARGESPNHSFKSAPHRGKSSQATATSSPSIALSQPKVSTPTKSLTTRDTMGLVGVPDQQRRALVATEHKMMKREHRAMLQQRWIVEKIANRQKNFKVRLSKEGSQRHLLTCVDPARRSWSQEWLNG